MGYSTQLLGNWVAWTPTYTGFSANPTGGNAKYTLIGKTCIVWHQPSAGTSNATTFTFTLPFTAKAVNVIDIIVINNGTQQAGRAQTSVGSNILTVYATPAAGAFTASGSKNAQISGFIYEIE